MTTYPLAGVTAYYQETRYYYNGDYLWLVWLKHGKRVSERRLLTTNELNTLLAGKPLAAAA